MGLDLTKLTPAPWTYDGMDCFDEGEPVHVIGPSVLAIVPCEHSGVVDQNFWEEAKADLASKADAEFIALARNDLDVKLRRGWHTEKCTDKAGSWYAPQFFCDVMGLMMQDRISHDLHDSFFEAAYQTGHDVGLLTKADRWYKANIEARDGKGDGP